jgi:ferredoxin
MPKEFVGTWEEQWGRMIKWMRALPTMFRLTRIPLIGRLLFRDSFVGDPTARNWVIPVHEELPHLTNVHLPFDILQPMIEMAAIRARAAKCICRSSFECEDYPADVACLFLGRAFKNADSIGKGFVELLTVEQALAHAHHAVEMGLVPTIVWDNDTEMCGESRDTGIAVCFCCDCCCDIRLGLKMGGDEFRKKVRRVNGVDLHVRQECNLCGACADPGVCPSKAISLGTVRAEIDLDRCVGCGRCIPACPSNAISFSIDRAVDVVGRLIDQVREVTDIT